MKKLIITAAFLMFGTIVITAQTTQKKDAKTKMTEKSTKSTEMKSKTPGQNDAIKTVDTANLEQRQKKEDEKLQRQAIPQKDGLNNEAVKPAQPTPEHME